MWLKFDFSMLGGLCIKLVGELAPACTCHTKHSKPPRFFAGQSKQNTNTLRVCIYICIIIWGMGSGVYYMYVFR